MENENGGLSLLEGFMEAIGKKNKEIKNYDRWELGDFIQKDTWKHLIMLGIISGIQHYKSDDNRRVDANPGEAV